MSLIHETVGSELANQAFSHARSTQDIIVNEDWVMVAKITDYSEITGVVKGEKVWDTSGTKTVFNGFAKYNGVAGIPSDTEVEVNAYTPFHRVGEFNTAIDSASPTPAIRTDGANSYSWLIFVTKVV